jgi:hypothetical protein
MESYYNIGNDVISLQETITNWLKLLSDEKKGFPADLLFFMRLPEGGMTTQRIQDALLLIRSYFCLFETYSVKETIILRSHSLTWEDDVFVYAARSKGIRVQEVGKLNIRVLIGKLKYILKSFAYEPYYFLNYLIIKLHSLGKNKRIPQKSEIAFQLCSAASKHVENVISPMMAFDRKKYCPVALCWEAGRGAKKVRKKGLIAVELENWVSILDWVQSLRRTVWTWITLRKKRGEFVNNPKISYLNVPLGVLLLPSVFHLIVAEMGQRYRLMKASKAYFRRYRPLAISTWGINDLPQGKITLKSLDNSKKPMLFKYLHTNILLESPYRLVYKPIDLYLVGGELQRKFYVDNLGKPPEKIEIVGQPRYDNLEKFKKHFSSSLSYTYLKIPTYYDYYILYDYGGFMRGYLSIQEINITLNTLKEFIKKNKRVALIIKPHPSAIKLSSIKSIKNILDKNIPNMFILDKDMLPYHALNCSDFLITKFSTLGIEAMLFKKPVISVILDKESQWKCYQNAADYIFNVEEMLDLLNNIVIYDEFYLNWKKRHIERQEDFLASCFSVSMTSNSELMVKAIEKHLCKYS